MARKRPAINGDTYKKYAKQTEERYERELATHGLDGRSKDFNRLLGFAYGIGNMHAEFGDLEPAKVWYERALEYLRQIRTDPNTLAAHMLWRMGDRERLEQECRAAIAHHGARVEAFRQHLAAASEQDRYGLIRSLALSHYEVATAHLYLREFKGAVEDAVRSDEEAPFSPQTGILRALADALDRQDQVAYEEALRAMRGRVDPWPTFESDSAIDLYRLAIAYGKECFGSIPADLEEELLK